MAAEATAGWPTGHEARLRGRSETFRLAQSNLAFAQTHATPARTALILASEPAFAGLFAWLLKGEVLDAWGWVGAGLIMSAIVAVELVPYLRPVRPLPEG